MSVAKYVKERGFDTYGYDISIKAVDRAKKTAEIKQTIDFGSEDFDVFMISVFTHKPDDIFSPLNVLDYPVSCCRNQQIICLGFFVYRHTEY